MKLLLTQNLGLDPNYTSGGLYSRTAFIYNYNTSTLTPIVKPCNILNLAVQNILFKQSYMESTFMFNPGLTKFLVLHSTFPLPKVLLKLKNCSMLVEYSLMYLPRASLS